VGTVILASTTLEQITEQAVKGRRRILAAAVPVAS
jgi:hypothetical protein